MVLVSLSTRTCNMHVVSSQGCGGSTLSCRLVDGVGSCGGKVMIKSAIFLRPPETYRLDRSDRARYIHNSVTWFLFSFRKQSIILSHFINNFNFSDSLSSEEPDRLSVWQVVACARVPVPCWASDDALVHRHRKHFDALSMATPQVLWVGGSEEHNMQGG